MLVFEVFIDPPGASDVVKRRLSVVVDGVEERQVDLPASCVKVGGLKFHEGCDVHMTLWDIDDAGNVSPPAVYNFTAKDTIAPPAPGGFGASIIGEAPDGPALEHAEAHSHADGKHGEGQKIAPEMNTPDLLPEINEESDKARDTDGPQKTPTSED